MKLAITLTVVVADDATLGDVRTLRSQIVQAARRSDVVRDIDEVTAALHIEPAPTKPEKRL